MGSSLQDKFLRKDAVQIDRKEQQAYLALFSRLFSITERLEPENVHDFIEGRLCDDIADAFLDTVIKYNLTDGELRGVLDGILAGLGDIREGLIFIKQNREYTGDCQYYITRARFKLCGSIAEQIPLTKTSRSLVEERSRLFRLKDVFMEEFKYMSPRDVRDFTHEGGENDIIDFLIGKLPAMSEKDNRALLAMVEQSVLRAQKELKRYGLRAQDFEVWNNKSLAAQVFNRLCGDLAVALCGHAGASPSLKPVYKMI